jgi:hypothetical protein
MPEDRSKNQRYEINQFFYGGLAARIALQHHLL